jgi:hypothetical protein
MQKAAKTTKAAKKSKQPTIKERVAEIESLKENIIPFMTLVKGVIERLEGRVSNIEAKTMAIDAKTKLDDFKVMALGEFLGKTSEEIAKKASEILRKDFFEKSHKEDEELNREKVDKVSNNTLVTFSFSSNQGGVDIAKMKYEILPDLFKKNFHGKGIGKLAFKEEETAVEAEILDIVKEPTKKEESPSE